MKSGRDCVGCILQRWLHLATVAAVLLSPTSVAGSFLSECLSGKEVLISTESKKGFISSGEDAVQMRREPVCVPRNSIPIWRLPTLEAERYLA